jgi:hypothetical protein
MTSTSLKEWESCRTSQDQAEIHFSTFIVSMTFYHSFRRSFVGTSEEEKIELIRNFQVKTGPAFRG